MESRGERETWSLEGDVESRRETWTRVEVEPRGIQTNPIMRWGERGGRRGRNDKVWGCFTFIIIYNRYYLTFIFINLLIYILTELNNIY